MIIMTIRTATMMPMRSRDWNANHTKITGTMNATHQNASMILLGGVSSGPCDNRRGCFGIGFCGMLVIGSSP
jgi:hypothetical protein